MTPSSFGVMSASLSRKQTACNEGADVINVIPAGKNTVAFAVELASI